jgi:hypothetical protein
MSKPTKWIMIEPPMVRIVGRSRPDRGTIGPSGTSDCEGMVYFHWCFDSFANAETSAAALATIRPRTEVVLLRLSNCDDPQSSFTFKDERHVRH